MPQVAISSVIEFSRHDFGLVWPGQITHVSPFSLKAQTLRRSPGLWRGTSRIPEAESDQFSREVQAFLASLEGQNNWFDLPLDVPYPDTAVRPRVASQSSVNGLLVTNLNTTDIDPVYRRGDYVTVENRLYIVHERVAARRYRLFPQVVLSAGESINPGLTVRARRADDSENLGPHRPDWDGPWSLNWIEHI